MDFGQKKEMNVIEIMRCQSELYESIMKLDPDCMELVRKHEEVLDKDIKINVGSICRCGSELEHHFIEEFHQATEMIDKMCECIRRGECTCSSEGPGHHKSRFVTFTFVQLAASANNVELLQLLAFRGHVFNTQTELLGLSPIFIAVARRHDDASSFLLSRKDIEINAVCTKEHLTPLMRAVQHKKADPVRKILQVPGIDINVKNSRGENPVMLSLRWHNEEIYNLLVEAGADVNSRAGDSGNSLLMMAVLKGIPYVTKLLERGVDVNYTNSRDETALHFAVYVDSVEITKALLDANVNLDVVTSQDNMAPIVFAASQGSTALTQLLAKKGANINLANSQGYNAVHLAAWYQHTDMLKFLLECEGVEHDRLTNDKNSPLALAAHGSHAKAIEMLLPLGCNVSNQDKDHDTALHYATYNGMTDTVRLLLHYGADPDAKNKFSATPLWNAVYGKHKEVVKLLLGVNVELEVTSVGIDQHYQSDIAVPLFSTPVSPLYVAIHRECTEIFYLLLSAGYDVYKEQWIFSGDHPENVAHLISVMKKQASRPPRLVSICRNYFRRYGNRRKLNELVQNLELPTYLKNYLLLTELLKDSGAK